MTNGTTDVVRGEFEMLKSTVANLERRVESIDDHGTRGVVGLQAQIVDLVKDVTELKADLVKRFDNHDSVHRKEEDDRRATRRWIIGMSIAAMAALAAILTVVITILMHVKH